MKINIYKALTGAAGAIVIAGTITLVVPHNASATAKFATETGKSCADCHVNPKGKGALTALGEQFKANGNKMPQ